MKKGLFIILCMLSVKGMAFETHKDSIKDNAQNEQTLDDDGARTGADGNLDLRYKPYLGLGAGNLTFFGDIFNNNKGQHLTVSRLAAELRFTHPITDYLDFQFHTMFGRVSANERSIENLTRNLNFESRIRAGGIGLSYNFDHILKKKRGERDIEPFIYAGIESFEFLSKTDLYDLNGNRYHYWDDGSIRNLAQNDPNASSAIFIQRDYIYETDLREQNIDGLGQYPERSWAFPVGVGFNINITDHFRLRVASTMHFTTTDLVDNVTSESIGDRAGTKGKDKFLFSNFTVSYSLKPLEKKVNEDEPVLPPWEVDIFAKDTFDTDMDGVVDFQDICAYTPKDCRPVEANGCPQDDDLDGVPDCIDKELNSPGPYINSEGVTLTDEMIEEAFRRYKDSTGEFSEIEVTSKHTVIIDNPLAPSSGGGIDPGENSGKEYFVVIDKKPENIKANELYKYLQYKRFKTIHEGDSVYYVLDGLDLSEAALLEKDLNKNGVSTKQIGKLEVTNTGKVVVIAPTSAEIEEALSKNATIPEITHSDEITYRVQIGAYNKSQNSRKFIGIPDIVEFYGADQIYRYYSGSFDNLQDASMHKIIMTAEAGFPDAFVVAFKEGKRISLKEVTEVTEGYDEKIDEYENAVKGSGDYSFTIQVGAFKGTIPNEQLELFRNLGAAFKFAKDEDGTTKYFVGNYKTEEEARKASEEFKAKGVEDAFIMVEKDGKMIELKDAQDIINGGN